jgi:hypothetical protein
MYGVSAVLYLVGGENWAVIMQIELSDFEWSEVFLHSRRCLASPTRTNPSVSPSSLIIKEKRNEYVGLRFSHFSSAK